MKATLAIFSGVLVLCCVQAQYSPPVREPNDCPIRCITTPCPCGATCPTLSCPTNCRYWALDNRDCNTCQCDLSDPPRRDCPLRKCRPCPSGEYKVDSNGCHTCECENVPCAQPLCSNRCPNGYKKNSRGCDTCECEGSTLCRAPQCFAPCAFGSNLDRNGCETCDCKDAPCPVLRCANQCSNGYKKNSRGCDTCQCADIPCPQSLCAAPCPHGYKTSAAGCQTCECVEEPVACNKRGCANMCPFGYERDENGCMTCECKSRNQCRRPQCFAPCAFGSNLDQDGCETCDCITCPRRPSCAAVLCGAGQEAKEITPARGCPTCMCANKKVDKKEKSGSCPAPSRLPGICVAECSFDSECSGDQKCCGGCPRKCTDPVKKAVSKPGRCPRLKPGFVGACVAKCSDDSSCPGNQKCCGSCPRQCTRPRGVPSTGRCPARYSRFLGRFCPSRITDRCSSNSDCKNGRICCGSCPKRCVRPSRRFSFHK